MNMSKKKMWIIIGAVLAGFLVIGTIGNALNPPEPPASAPVAPTPEAPAEETEAPAEPTKEPEAVNDLAERTEAAAKTAFAVDEFSDLFGDLPDSLVPFIADMTSPSTGTVVVTVQVTKDSTTKDELADAARALHSLVGLEIEDLNRVEFVTADSLERGVSNRHDVPLLNR